MTLQPHDLDQIISVRLPGRLAADLRDYANEHGKTVSDVLRETIARLVEKPVGWSCAHFNITSLPGALGPVTGWCGCAMTPLYARDLPLTTVRGETP